MQGGHNLFITLQIYIKSIREMNAVFKRTTHTDAVFLLSLIISATLWNWSSCLA